MSWCSTFTWRSEESSPMFYYWHEEEVNEMLASDFMRQFTKEIGA